MAEETQCKKSDKPIPLSKEKENEERRTGSTYLALGILVFIYLFYITQVDTTSTLLKPFEFVASNIITVFGKIVSLDTDQTSPYTDSEIFQLSRRNMTFFLSLFVFFAILAYSWTIPSVGGERKSQHAIENTGNEADDIGIGILIVSIWMFMIIVALKFDTVRPAFTAILLIMILLTIFLFYKVYLFNTNVYHMSVQTFLYYFMFLNLVGFIGISISTKQGGWSIKILSFVAIVLTILFGVLTYKSLEEKRDQQNEYKVERHKISRIFVYVFIATLLFIFSIIQNKAVFNMERLDKSFIADAGVREFFTTYTNKILSGIGDVRVKAIASVFVYLFVGLASFGYGSFNIVIEFLKELSVSV
jgi:hypothetical protein